MRFSASSWLCYNPANLRTGMWETQVATDPSVLLGPPAASAQGSPGVCGIVLARLTKNAARLG